MEMFKNILNRLLGKSRKEQFYALSGSRDLEIKNLKEGDDLIPDGGMGLTNGLIIYTDKSVKAIDDLIRYCRHKESEEHGSGTDLLQIALQDGVIDLSMFAGILELIKDPNRKYVIVTGSM